MTVFNLSLNPVHKFALYQDDEEGEEDNEEEDNDDKKSYVGYHDERAKKRTFLSRLPNNVTTETVPIVKKSGNGNLGNTFTEEQHIEELEDKGKRMWIPKHLKSQNLCKSW